MTARAPKGGAFGANGEWYEGGKFINSVPENAKRRGSSKRGSGKMEVEPYRWEVPPAVGLVSLYRQLAGVFGVVDASGVFIIRNTSDAVLRYTGRSVREVESMVAAYNRGVRWVQGFLPD